MEVRMEPLDLPGQTNCLPKDIFVAFRLGDVQKQSRLSAGAAKTFHFPPAAALTAKAGGKPQQQPLAGRVEIFRRVGAENVSLEMLSSAGGSTVEIPCADLPEVPRLSLHFELLAGAGAGEELAAEVAEARAKASKESRRKERLDSAQRYISEHNLEEVLASSLREVVREKPADPHQYLSRQILGLKGQGGQGCKTSGNKYSPSEELSSAGQPLQRVGGSLLRRSRSNSAVRLEPLPSSPTLQQQLELGPAAAPPTVAAAAAKAAAPAATAAGTAAVAGAAEEAELATKAKAREALVAALDLGDDDEGVADASGGSAPPPPTSTHHCHQQQQRQQDGAPDGGKGKEEDEEEGESVRVRAADMLVLSLANGSLAAALENTLRTCLPADDDQGDDKARRKAVEEEGKKEARVVDGEEEDKSNQDTKGKKEKEKEGKEDEKEARAGPSNGSGGRKEPGVVENSSSTTLGHQTPPGMTAKQRAKEALEQIFQRSILTATQSESAATARGGGAADEGGAAAATTTAAAEVVAGGGAGASSSSAAPAAQQEEAPETAVEKPHAAAGRPGLRRLKSQAALPNRSQEQPSVSLQELDSQQGEQEGRVGEAGEGAGAGGVHQGGGPGGPGGPGRAADVMQESSRNPEITSPTSRDRGSAPATASQSFPRGC